MSKAKLLPDTQTEQIRQIITDAMANRPVVHLNIQIPADVDADHVAALIQRILMDFHQVSPAEPRPPETS